MDEGCNWYDVGCHVGGWIAGVAESATEALAKSVAGAAQWALELTGDFIVNISGLTAFNESEAGWVQSTVAPYVSLLAVVAVLIAAIQMIWTQRGEPVRELLASLIRLVVVSGAAGTGIILATQAADELAAWLIQSSGGSADFMANMASFIKLNKLVAPFVIILAGIVAIIGALIQAMLLLVRGVFLTLLMGVLPLTAAASNTSWGQDWFKKASTWVVAFILYKPAIAIILALGYRLMGSPTAAQATMTTDEHIVQACGSDPYDMSRPGASEWGPHNPFNLTNEIGYDANQWNQCADGIREQLAGAGIDTAGAISFLQGLIIICFAAFAMPALIRFIMPAAAAMSSGGGSAMSALAGSVVGGMIAGGARHVTTGAGRGGSSGPSGSSHAANAAGGTSSASGSGGGGSSGGGSSGPSGSSQDVNAASGASGSGPSESGLAGGSAGGASMTAGAGSGGRGHVGRTGVAGVAGSALVVGGELAGGVSDEAAAQTGDGS